MQQEERVRLFREFFLRNVRRSALHFLKGICYAYIPIVFVVALAVHDPHSWEDSLHTLQLSARIWAIVAAVAVIMTPVVIAFYSRAQVAFVELEYEINDHYS